MDFDTISRIFSAYQNVRMWTLCRDKVPVTKTGALLKWGEDSDDINTLPVILERQKGTEFGIGLFLGRENNLVCYDLDDALDEAGNIINPEVTGFLEVLGTSVETSVSGKGLHVFAIVERPADVVLGEYAYKKSFAAGRCYTGSRFIKLTGNCFSGFDTPLAVLNEMEFRTIERKISATHTPPSFNRVKSGVQSDIASGTTWDEILSEVGIVHVKSAYDGKERTYPDGTTRTALESYRIPCPNKRSHTGINRRTNQFGPDAAILCKWDDGSTSVSCNHHHCDPSSRPNLLKKLWQEIRTLRADDGKEVLSQYDGVLS